MSIFDRQPRLRWAVPAAAGGLILVGSLAGSVVASADSGLAPRTAQELLVDLQTPQATAISGTVVASADLGLPALPSGMGTSTDVTSLMSGSHTLRVWSDGPERMRVALVGSADESDVIRNGRDVWVWSSAQETADHYVLPARDTPANGRAVPGAAGLPSTPAEAARLVLSAIDGTTEVTTSGVDQVAGRPVYELILTPKQSDTLVARVVVAIDAQTHVPLRVQVFSTAMPDPAYEVGFTSVDFARPDAGLFAFSPPPSAVVTEHPAQGLDDAIPLPSSTPAHGSVDEPTVVGAGWSQVVIADDGQLEEAVAGSQSAGAGSAQSAGGLDVAGLLKSLPLTSGSWGSGRVLTGTLFSAILTDDGRIAVGAVTPETLGAALAAQ